MKHYPVGIADAVASNVIAFPVRSASGLASQEELDFYSRMADLEFERTGATDMTRAYDEAGYLLTELCSQRRPIALAERHAALQDTVAKLTYQRPGCVGDFRHFVDLPGKRLTGDLAFAVGMIGCWVRYECADAA